LVKELVELKQKRQQLEELLGQESADDF